MEGQDIGSYRRVDPYSPPPTASCTNVEDVENIKVSKTHGHLQAIFLLWLIMIIIIIW